MRRVRRPCLLTINILTRPITRELFWEFWSTRVRSVPGCTSFPLTPGKGGHNSQNRGTEPGNCGGFPTGIYEVIFSHIWMAEQRTGWSGGVPGAGSEIWISVPAIDDGLFRPGPGPAQSVPALPHHTQPALTACDHDPAPGFLEKKPVGPNHLIRPGSRKHIRVKCDCAGFFPAGAPVKSF